MKIDVKKLPKSSVKLNIQVPNKDIQKYFDKAFTKLAPSVTIKGFRPGKAPKLMIIDAIGQGRYNSEALNLALSDVYVQALQQEKIIPLSQPAININQFSENQDLDFDAQVDVVPEIKIDGYKNIKVDFKKKEIAVKDEDIKKIIKRLRYQAAKFSDKADGAQNGDRIEIEFAGSIKGVQSEQHTSKNYPLVLGEGILVPGFEEKLVGMKKNESKNFKIKIGKDEIDFKVKMLDVKKADLPELNKEFAKKFGHDSVEKLEEAIGKGIVSEHEIQQRQELENKVLDVLVKKISIEMPEILIREEIARKIQQLQTQTGPGFNDFLAKSNKKITDLENDLRPSAEQSVKIGLALGEIAKDMGLFKEKPKTEADQREIVKKTIDKLIEIATSADSR